MPLKIIDAHLHAWDLNHASYEWLKGREPILNRNYYLEEINEERLSVGITAGILVQAANNVEDTDWMLNIALQTNWIAAVVGWLPLKDPAATRVALREKYLTNIFFKGVRHLINDEPDNEWLLQDEVLESLQILADFNIPYDVVGIVPAHLKAVLKVAERVPNLRMVLDHLNQPPIPSKQRYGIWGELMQEAALHKNFHIKISGLGSASGNLQSWADETLAPYIDFSLQHFGEDRCFCGSDWPVSLLAGSYARHWIAYQNILKSLLSNGALEKVLYDNAKKFYNLNV